MINLIDSINPRHFQSILFLHISFIIGNISTITIRDVGVIREVWGKCQVRKLV